ncbi:MAG: carboxymuconolactone decarboxylase family protein [Planctomycetes bacterium]|nr:carboxymuconolactone decarboxylase family protein [Planctomycetota bacterium]
MEASEFKVKELLDATSATASLTDREKHLIGLAVTATRGCVACTGGRIETALKVGIEYETVRAAIDLAAAVNAGVTLRTALEGAERNSVQAACVGAECSVGTSG